MYGRAWVGLGSNLGDPLANLRRAAAAVHELPGTRIQVRASIYRSRAWGDPDQPDFLNSVIRLETRMEPRALLRAMLGIEGTMGRIRDGRRWGPRIIDLDLLLYGRLEIHSDELELPHPRISERAFVLAPLLEIDPLLDIPGYGSAKRCFDALGRPEIEALEADW